VSAWPLKRLAELGAVSTGSTPRTAEPRFYGGDLPFVTPSELDTGLPVTTTPRTLTDEGAAEARVLPEGSVMVCCIGSLGKTGIAGRSVATNQQINSVVFDRDKVWPRFGFYACRLLKPKLDCMAPATTLPIVSKSKFAELTIPVPPLAEQRRIAEVLDRAEALRAKRRAALAQLDSLTQSLFVDLFGDPATNPKGWPKATLGDVTEMVTGYPFRSEEYVTNCDSVRLCRGANILPGRVDWSDLARWPESKAAGLADFNLEAGDVVIAMDRPWISEGFKIARVQPEDCPALLVQRVARLRGKKEMPNAFLFHLLNQPAFTRHCRPTETTIPHISPKDIRSFAFPLPPIPLQREFARRVTAVEALKTAPRASLTELDALFATLQHRAFCGEL